MYFPIFLLANESLRGFLDKYAKWSFAVWFLVLIGQGHRNVQERGTHFGQICILNPKISNNYCGPNTGWNSSFICLAYFDPKRVHIKAFSLLRFNQLFSAETTI